MYRSRYVLPIRTRYGFARAAKPSDVTGQRVEDWGLELGDQGAEGLERADRGIGFGFGSGAGSVTGSETDGDEAKIVVDVGDFEGREGGEDGEEGVVARAGDVEALEAAGGRSG